MSSGFTMRSLIRSNFLRASVLCFIGSLLLTFVDDTVAQETAEQRLDRLEARIDTLFALHGDRGLPPDTSEIISDASNLYWGYSGPVDLLLDKDYFVINYHGSWKIARWVAYYLSAADLDGETGRTDDFRLDPEIPRGSRAKLSDYRRSGYDRGHMAPAASFKRSHEAMSTTFLLSNMAPQTPRLNRRIWRILETDIRDVVRLYGEAWIFTGNIFMSVDSQFTSPWDSIGNNKVAVPSHCFKAVLTSDENGIFRAYAFLIPNSRAQVPGDPEDYLLTVDRLEEITGYNFFPVLVDSIEVRIESKIHDTWP